MQNSQNTNSTAVKVEVKMLSYSMKTASQVDHKATKETFSVTQHLCATQQALNHVLCVSAAPE